LVDWEKGGAVGITGVSGSSGCDSNDGTSFFRNVIEGGETGGGCFETRERAPVYEEVFRCVGANRYHQGYLKCPEGDLFQWKDLARLVITWFLLPVEEENDPRLGPIDGSFK
jgi:hypothetical protein